MTDSLFSFGPQRLWQEINPWTIAGKQFGFINIYSEASQDHELENQIVHEIAGYGRQLGRISEVIEVLFELIDVDSPEMQNRLDADARAAIDDFKQMQSDIKKLKSLYGSKDQTERRIEQLERELKKLRGKVPASSALSSESASSEVPVNAV